jgi:hypothetical protein
MSIPRRWALAFVNAAGPDPGGALAFLRTALPLLEKLPHTAVSGWAAGRRLEAALRSALAAGEGRGPGAGVNTDRAVEAAIRTTALLARKGRFRYFSSFVDEAEKIIDERAGILRALVETASPPEAGFEDRLRAVLKRKKNVSDVKLDIRIVPQLLAGCRISIGSEYVDGSLLGRLNGMTRDLGSGAQGVF